ncbi:MaoC family dehydratase, partial [Mycobacteroides abscessus subsp. massiliense]
MTFGTFDEGRAWVGHRSEPRHAWFPIDRSMVL